MIATDEAMPAGTAVVKDFCPWHEQSGTKGSSARYFNKDGQELEG
jgi:hypothetical protein